MSRAAGLGLQRQDKAVPGKRGRRFWLGFAPSGSLCKGLEASLGSINKSCSGGWNGLGVTLPEKVISLMLCFETGPNINI